MCALGVPPDKGPITKAMDFFEPIHAVLVPYELLAGFRAEGVQGVHQQVQGLVGRDFVV